MTEIIKNKVSQLPSIKEGVNPFPGLRPFGIDESYLFFGRDGQSEEILKLLDHNRFVAVIGASGTGKSSLIYCGLLPLLYGGFIATAGSKWRTIIFRPGNNPIENLAQSISVSYQSQIEKDTQHTKEFFAATLRRSSFGIVEALKFLPNSDTENILLLVDQFEELFRYRQHSQTGDEPETFVRLLVEAMNQSEIPVYTVLTMRSDFIGECSQYQELTSLINRSNYLIPQMTRDDFRSAIIGPLQVAGVKIDSALTNQVLNDVGDNADQLPILQHTMMRTWEYWHKGDNADSVLGIDEYEAIGRLDKALSDHANEAFDELSERGKRVCEILFKTITEKGADNRGIRRPTKLADIAEIAKTTPEEVMEVADTFRKTGRSFLTPSQEIALTPNTIIDLSHESLMRIWNRLKIWVEEESSAVQMYQRLSEAGALYHEGKTSLWRPPDLLLALSWESKQQPSLTWAKRYNPAFERTIVFLHTSATEFEAEERNKIRQQKRILQRTRISAIIMGFAAIFSLGFMIYANMMKGQAEISKKDAVEQSEIAKKQKKIADLNAQDALVQKTEALKQKEYADKQSEVAKEQSEIALKKEAEARMQKEYADRKSIEANDQKKIAEKNAVEANQQKTAAERAREDAYARRILSISQAMAIKSLRIDEDVNLKALLAYQSYIFNTRYQGNAMDADVYGGLNAALSTLKGKGYNYFKSHKDAVNAIVNAQSTNVFYSASSDGRILQWNIQDSTRKSTVFFEHKFSNKCLAISKNKRWLACGTLGGGIIVLDLSDKANHKIATELGTLIYAISFVNQDVVVAGAENKLVKWNLVTGEKTLMSTADGTIISVAVSPDGKQVAYGTNSGKVILCNFSNPDFQNILSDDSKNSVYAIAFSHNGEKLVTGSLQGYLKIWSTRNNKLEASVRNHTARITSIQFSHNDKLIATSSYDQSVVMWNAEDINMQPIKLKDHESWTLAAAFNSDGTKLLTGARDEPRMIGWNTSNVALAQQVGALLKRNLTQTEWNTYVGKDIPYELTKSQ